MRRPRPTWLHCVLFSSRLWGGTSRGGGISFTVKNSLQKHISKTASFPCHLTSFDAAQLTLTLNPERIHVFCVYRSPPGKRNKLPDTTLFDQLPNFLEHCDGLTGKLITMGDFNFHSELDFRSLSDVRRPCFLRSRKIDFKAQHRTTIQVSKQHPRHHGSSVVNCDNIV